MNDFFMQEFSYMFVKKWRLIAKFVAFVSRVCSDLFALRRSRKCIEAWILRFAVHHPVIIGKYLIVK